MPATVVLSSDPQALAGVELFNSKGCLYCHDIAGHGDHRGPDLRHLGKRLDKDEAVIRIVNGGDFMPAYGGSLSKEEIEQTP